MNQRCQREEELFTAALELGSRSPERLGSETRGW